MPRPRSKLRTRLREAGATLALLTLVACSGKACTCVTPIPGGFPKDKRHDNAIQVRATQGMFQYLSAHGASLVPTLLGGGGIFNVPPVCGSNKVCCAMPAPMCRIQITAEQLALTPTPKDTLHLDFTTQLKTLDQLPVEFAIGPLTAKCFVSLDTTKGTAGHTDIDIVGDLQFSVEAATDLTRLGMNNAAVNNLDQSMIDLKSQPGDILCTVANFALIKGFVVSQISSQLAGQLGSTVSSQLCMKCTTQTDCNSFATACTNGQCMEADGKTCVQEIGLEGRMDVGSLLASFAPGLSAGVDIYAVAGGYAAVDTGLSLGLLGGAQSDPHSSCVPMVAPPVPPTVKQSTTFETDLLPDKATPYHVGIGVHKSELDTIGWSVFDSGGLCLHVGTPSVALLSTKTIGLVIQSLQDLVHVGNAPMFLGLRPSQPPTFTMGKGTFKTDAMGKITVDDPVLHVSLPGFAMDFFAWTDDRYVRIMTLNADVDLGVAIDVDGTGHLVPMLGDVSHAFKNVYVTNSDLLAESPQDLAKAFPMLLGIAVGQITSALKPIALPSVLGLNLKPLAVTSSDPDANGENQFLSIFADISTTTPKAFTVDTSAAIDHVELPTTREFAVDARGAREPIVWLQLGSPTPPLEAPFEYSFAVDDGTWSPFSPATLVGVTDARLWMQGHHQIAVRARVQGDPESLDPTPALVDAVIDTVAPDGGFDVAGHELAVDASDAVSPPEALQFRWRAWGGTFSAWQPATTRATLPAGVKLDSVEVQARDEAGNIGDLGFHGRTTAPSPSGCACDVGGAGGDARLPALAIIGLALVLVRRRRGAARAIALVAAGGLLAGGALSGCSSGLGKGDYESPLDEIGRYQSIAVEKTTGVIHVSAYDDSMGDLAYARITDPKKNISWQYVDGIDPAAAVDMKGSYRHGVSDPGPDVGQYTSIALDKASRPRIAYFDATDGALRFALGPHPFTTYTIDAGTASAPVGMYAALSLDRNDVPSIAYVATGISDGMNGFKSELRVATARNASPSASDWTIVTADSTAISCAGRCGAGTACIMTAMVNGMANGDPSISTCTPVDAMPCASACSSTQACIKGACTAFIAPPGAADLIEGTGLFVQARRDSMDNLQLVYYDRDKGSLKLASASGSSFTTSFLDGNSMTADVGQFATVAIASDDSLHVAYVDAIKDRLVYKHVVGGMAPATAEVVDDGTRADGPHSVGAGANLVLDASGNPRIVYQDQTLADLELGTRADMWSHSDLATGIPGYGFYPLQITAGGKQWLFEFVYDRENGGGASFGQLLASPMN